MKFKAKPRLTPDRLRGRLNKANGRNPSLRTFTMEVDCLPIIFDSNGVSSLISEINAIVPPPTKCKADFHCDADFY